MILEKGSSIKIDARRCLNRRYRGAECRHCLNSCPAEALTLREGHIDLDCDRCIGCGLCLSDCPTQVFRSDDWDETSIIDQVKNRAWYITELFCAKHPAPYQEAQTPDRGALQLPGCLAMVSKGAWYELGLHTVPELHLEPCAGCPMNKTMPRLELAVDTASEWLSASGHIAKFNFIQAGRKGKNHLHLRAVETGFRITSRRDLFLSVIRRGGPFTGPLLKDPKRHPEDNGQESIFPVPPDWLKRLAKAYPRNPAESPSRACWPTIKINSRCVHCGICALLCPSGALQCVKGIGTCSYTFVGGLCLDCRICQMVCEEEAIAREKEPTAKPFESIIIFNAPVMECESCGGVASAQNNGLCHWCRTEKAIDRSFNTACHALLMDTEG